MQGLFYLNIFLVKFVKSYRGWEGWEGWEDWESWEGWEDWGRRGGFVLRSAYASRTKRQLRGRGPSHPEQNPFGEKGGERNAPQGGFTGTKALR